ncbi:uncharacterized protein LOC102808742 [Saccoglossus kowalevskii]
MGNVKQQKSSLQNIQTFVEQRNKVVNQCVEQLQKIVDHVGKNELEQKDELLQKISLLEKQVTDFEESKNTLEAALKTTQETIQGLRDSENQHRQREQECERLNREIQKFRNELESEHSKCRTLSSETAQYKELLNRKTQEVDDISIQVRKRDQISEQTIVKLQQELKHKIEELQSSVLECQKLRNKAQEQARLEQDRQRNIAMSKGQTEELKSVLSTVQEELEGLKSERELMISSHQNRIEQLKESFKQKLAESEKWPSKMVDNIQKERDKCACEKKALEEKLKESFTMELEIEKQKHQELLDKYQREYEDQMSQLRHEIRNQNSQHRMEISRMERQIIEAKHHGINNESSFKGEIQSLKNIISNLEDSLAKSGTECDDVITALRAELREAELDLSGTKNELKQLEDKYEHAKEEVTFLQDTVRRECEERFELTEALSEAREQLLQINRPSGGYVNSPRPSNQKTFIKDPGILKRKTSSSSISGTVSSESITNTTVGSPVLGNNLGGHNEGVKWSKWNSGKQSGALHSGGQENVFRIRSNNVSVGFDGVGMPPTKPAHVKPKEGSVDDSRQRIAAAVRRK